MSTKIYRIYNSRNYLSVSATGKTLGKGEFCWLPNSRYPLEKYAVSHIVRYQSPVFDWDDESLSDHMQKRLFSEFAYHHLSDLLALNKVLHTVDCQGHTFQCILPSKYDIQVESPENTTEELFFDPIGNQYYSLKAILNLPPGYHYFGCAYHTYITEPFLERIQAHKISGLQAKEVYPNPEEYWEVKGSPLLKRGTITSKKEVKKFPAKEITTWTSEEEVLTSLAEAGLDFLHEKIKQDYKWGVQLIPVETGPDERFAVGESKFGGIPDLPASFEWKKMKCRVNDTTHILNFLAQFNLEEIARVCPGLDLPKAGMIYVFCTLFDDASSSLYESEPKQRNYRVLLWEGDVSSLSRAQLPRRYFDLLDAYKLEMSASLMIPPLSPWDGSLAFEQAGIELDNEQMEKYYLLSCSTGPHRLLGHACGANEAVWIDGKASTLFLQMGSDEEIELQLGDLDSLFFYGAPDLIQKREYAKLSATAEFA